MILQDKGERKRGNENKAKETLDKRQIGQSYSDPIRFSLPLR